MSTGHKPPHPNAILNAMKRMVHERKDWDEDPELGCFYRAADDAVETFPIFVHPLVWHQLENPKNVLRMINQVLAVPADGAQLMFGEALRDQVPDELCGAYLRTEGWTLPQWQLEEISRRVKAGQPYPRFQDRPDRVEMRMCSAVDATGRPYVVTQARDQPEMDALYEGMTGGARGLGGAVPDLLKNLTTLLTSPVPKEERP